MVTVIVHLVYSGQFNHGNYPLQFRLSDIFAFSEKLGRLIILIGSCKNEPNLLENIIMVIYTSTVRVWPFLCIWTTHVFSCFYVIKHLFFQTPGYLIWFCNSKPSRDKITSWNSIVNSRKFCK